MTCWKDKKRRLEGQWRQIYDETFHSSAFKMLRVVDKITGSRNNKNEREKEKGDTERPPGMSDCWNQY